METIPEPWVKMKRGLFYGPNDRGYTGIRDLAGRYSEAAATAETTLEGVTAMPLAEAPEFAPNCYDDLAMKHLRQQRDTARKDLELTLRAILAEPDGAALAQRITSRVMEHREREREYLADCDSD